MTLAVDQIITPQGKLQIQGLIKALNIVPNSILIVKTDGDPTPIVGALQELGGHFPFDVPIIVLKRDEELVRASKKDLEDALELLARSNHGIETL